MGSKGGGQRRLLQLVLCGVPAGGAALPAGHQLLHLRAAAAGAEATEDGEVWQQGPPLESGPALWRDVFQIMPITTAAASSSALDFIAP